MIDHSQTIARLFNAYPRERATDENRTAYREAVEGFNHAAVLAAVKHLVKTSKRLPSIAELISTINSGAGNDGSPNESEDMRLARRMFAELGYEQAMTMTDAEILERFADDFRRLYPRSVNPGALSFLKLLLEQDRRSRMNERAGDVPR